MRRSDSAQAEPTPREKWLEQSTPNEASPPSVDYLTWQPIEQWGPRFGPIQVTGGSAFDRRLRLASHPRRCRPRSRPIQNPHYRGRPYLTQAQVSAELREIRARFSGGPLEPYLLAAVLIDRKVGRRRVEELVRSRFGDLVPLDDLLSDVSKARETVDDRLRERLGFVPKYQLRWVGPI